EVVIAQALLHLGDKGAHPVATGAKELVLNEFMLNSITEIGRKGTIWRQIGVDPGSGRPDSRAPLIRFQWSAVFGSSIILLSLSKWISHILRATVRQVAFPGRQHVAASNRQPRTTRTHMFRVLCTV